LSTELINSMMKKLISCFLILSGFTSIAQNLPTIVSYTVDTLCENSYDERFITIIVEDLDADSTYIDVVTPNNTVLDGQMGFTVINPPYVPGETLRTIEVYGTSFWGNPSGLNMADVNFEIVGNLTNDGVEADYDINNIPVYGPINVSLDLSSLTVCHLDNPIDISSYANPMGGVFDWGTNGLDEPSTGYFDPETYYLDPGDGIFYTYKNEAGCEGFDSYYLDVLISPDVSSVTTPSTCGSADGGAQVTATGQFPPFDVYWTTGFSEQVSSTSAISNLSSGTYYANVTDANGCTVQATAQVSDADIVVSEVITDQTCPNTGNGAIDLTVTGGTVSEVFWSNGATTEDISGLAGGEYTVHIHTTGNCSAFKSYNVASPPPLGIDIVDVQGADCLQGSQGNIDITTTGGSGSYTWDWNSGAWSGEDFPTPGVGVHNCVVTDVITGCTYDWDITVPDWGAPWISISKVIKPSCGQMNGEIEIQAFENTAPITSIAWNNAATTSQITGLDAGDYVVTVTDASGCTAVQDVELTYERPYQPSLCLLTVDTSYTYNEIVWEKDDFQVIDGFNVYRETQVMGNFELVANRPLDLESRFMDNAASPVDRSWRYYITTYDACGNESFPSFIHKTIHTVATTQNQSDYVISWDDYEGISYSSVDLFRYDDVNGWMNIGNYPVGTNSAPDTPPVTTELDYMVSFNLTDGCTSTKATNYNSSRSNKTKESAWSGGGTTTSIEDEDLGTISIYPNPTNGMLFVSLENTDKFNEIEIKDVQGRIIAKTTIINSQTSFDLSQVPSGMYFVQLIADEQVKSMKVIKE